MQTADSSMDLGEATRLEMAEYNAGREAKSVSKGYALAIAALMFVPVTVVALIVLWPKLPPWNVLH